VKPLKWQTAKRSSRTRHRAVGTGVAMLLAGDSHAAASNALQARTYSRGWANRSEWQALLIAAQASQNLGDKAKGHEYAMRATETFSNSNSAGAVKTISLTSVARHPRFRKQLEQLNSSQ